MKNDCKKKQKVIPFYYKTSDSKMEPIPVTGGTAWSGWAPCLDPVTNNKIGNFNFYYIQQPKYIDKDTQDGYLNELKMFFVLDKFQERGNAKAFDFVAEIEFEANTLNSRLPVGKYSTALTSSSFKINTNSSLKAEISVDGTRYFTLYIDWD